MGKQLRRPDIENIRSVTGQGFGKRLSATIEVPAKGFVNVSTSFVSVRPLIESSEAWISLMTQIGLQLTIEVAPELDLVWDIDSLFFGDLNPTSHDNPYYEKRATFSTNQVIFPYQGINLSWRPSSNRTR